MNTAPEFAAYPVAPAPVYSRWLAWGVALLVLSGSAGVALGSFIEPRTAVVGGVGEVQPFADAPALAFRVDRVQHLRSGLSAAARSAIIIRARQSAPNISASPAASNVR